MAANQEIHTLNDDEGSLTESSDLKLEEVEKNIRVLITKLKGAHMNEGSILGEHELNMIFSKFRWITSRLQEYVKQRNVRGLLQRGCKVKVHQTRKVWRR